jgi:hypothetical protein
MLLSLMLNLNFSLETMNHFHNKINVKLSKLLSEKFANDINC